MSDTYHYEDGAIHHDHKRVINIDHIGGDDLGKLLSDFWKDDAEEAEVVEEVDGIEVKAPVENHKPDTSTTPPQTIDQRVTACFEQGLLSVGKPYNKLFCLMAAMIARRMLKEKTVPAFVRMVSASYPALIQDGVTEENYIGAINDLTQKSRYSFSNYITDQKTMIDFVKSCYPQTSTGKERRDSQQMADNTNKIFLFLKED